MSVIVEVRVDGVDFELGRVLDLPDGTRVELRQPVSGDGAPVLFWVDAGRDVAETVEGHESVAAVRPVEEFADGTLYAVEWAQDGDQLLSAAGAAGGCLLAGRRDGDDWTLLLRFPDGASLSSFTDWCTSNGVDLTVERRYAARQPGGYGLTDRQRDTLVRAVERGYYDIPRTTTTQELADELGVSDQAITERLRRAITTLVGATLLSEEC